MQEAARKMTKEEALAFQARWRLVNEVINEEIRRTPLIEKLRQLEVMYQFTLAMGWDQKLKVEDQAVRDRWIKLKAAYV